MNKHLLTWLFTTCILPLAAQVTLTDAYFPVAGDTLRINVADSISTANVEVGEAGTDRSWNFGFPTVANERSEAVTDVSGNTEFPQATLLVQNTATTQSFYTVTESEFQLVGVNTMLNIFPDLAISTPINPARVMRRAPLAFQDMVASSTTSNSITISPDSLPEPVLEQLPTAITSVDSIRITTESTRSSAVDAYGVARLGDNFYDVLREMETESVFIRLETLISPFGFIDITATVGLISPELGRLVGRQDATITYYFWNPDSKEPIAEVATFAESGRPFSFNFKRALETTSTGNVQLTRAEMTAYPNPATDFVTFKFGGLSDGKHTLSLINIVGSVIEQRSFTPRGKQTQLKLEVGHLPAGLYLYSLRNTRGRVVGTRKLRVN